KIEDCPILLGRQRSCSPCRHRHPRADVSVNVRRGLKRISCSGSWHLGKPLGAHLTRVGKLGISSRRHFSRILRESARPHDGRTTCEPLTSITVTPCTLLLKVERTFCSASFRLRQVGVGRTPRCGSAASAESCRGHTDRYERETSEHSPRPSLRDQHQRFLRFSSSGGAKGSPCGQASSG